MTPEKQREAVARIAANTRWAFEPDRKAATKPARRGFLAKFEREVDPHEQLDAAERERRARSLMRAHMQRLAKQSAEKRQPKTSRPRVCDSTPGEGAGRSATAAA